MANYTRADAWCLFNGHDLTGHTMNFDPPGPEATFEEKTPWGATFEEYEPTGLVKWSAMLSAWYDDGEVVDDAIGAQAGNDRVLAWGLAGVTAGARCGFGNAVQGSAKPSISRGALTKITANFVGDGPAYMNARLLMRGTGSGSSFNGSTVDNAASSANGAVAACLVTSTNGTLTMKARHSTDGSSWADLITFAAVASGAAPSAEIKSVAGTVNRYTRAEGANSGGTTCQVAMLIERL